MSSTVIDHYPHLIFNTVSELGYCPLTWDAQLDSTKAGIGLHWPMPCRMWSSASGEVPHSSVTKYLGQRLGWRRIMWNLEKKVSGYPVCWVDLLLVRQVSLCTCPVLTVRPTVSSLYPALWFIVLAWKMNLCPCVREIDCHAEATNYPHAFWGWTWVTLTGVI